MILGKSEKKYIEKRTTTIEDAVNRGYKIRPAYRLEWYDAMELAWQTFLRFDAVDYTDEGIQSFKDFIEDPVLRRMYMLGSYQLFVAVDEQNKIVGIISLRNETHISLLFVDSEYHYQGIGRALIEYLCDYVSSEEGYWRVTVNASLYATEFYHKLGFKDTGDVQTSDGIRYTPMERVWKPFRK